MKKNDYYKKLNKQIKKDLITFLPIIISVGISKGIYDYLKKTEKKVKK